MLSLELASGLVSFWEDLVVMRAFGGVSLFAVSLIRIAALPLPLHCVSYIFQGRVHATLAHGPILWY